jgi:hypothetical protein
MRGRNVVVVIATLLIANAVFSVMGATQTKENEGCGCHQNISQPLTYEVGICDGFDTQSPPGGEPVDPSVNLINWIGAHYHGITSIKNCDEDTDNMYWAHTFYFTYACASPCEQIESAILNITLKNDHYNDHLKVGCITDISDTWEINEEMEAGGWLNDGQTGTISVYINDNSYPALLDAIRLNMFLDVAVDDDSPVDCATLTIICGDTTCESLDVEIQQGWYLFGTPIPLVITNTGSTACCYINWTVYKGTDTSGQLIKASVLNNPLLQTQSETVTFNKNDFPPFTFLEFVDLFVQVQAYNGGVCTATDTEDAICLFMGNIIIV